MQHVLHTYFHLHRCHKLKIFHYFFENLRACKVTMKDLNLITVMYMKVNIQKKSCVPSHDTRSMLNFCVIFKNVHLQVICTGSEIIFCLGGRGAGRGNAIISNRVCNEFYTYWKIVENVVYY